MPRQPRLDAPGLLQDVMARGIERTKIFRDDKDRKAFLDRLANILDDTQTQCYAWALLPNHFHLLLRTGTTPLSKVMRRLMTGYAVTFNKRHTCPLMPEHSDGRRERIGHLFQNRYKSIVCEEDAYLLELIRYIHLNPIRVGLVNDLRELDRYRWCGHSAILGKRRNPLIPHPSKQHNELKKPNKPSEREKPLAEKTIEDILLLFGNDLGEARKRYRHFVKQGISQACPPSLSLRRGGRGTRPELQGGRLVRSAGGNKVGLLGRKKEEREKGDERILGSGDFACPACPVKSSLLHWGEMPLSFYFTGVNEALMKAGEDWETGKEKKIPLAQLIRKVASHLDLKEESIFSASRRREISEARSIISCLAINDMPAPCSAACS